MLIKPWKQLGWVTWKLQISKGLVGKIYRYFLRKKVMKRINEVAKTLNKPTYDLSVPAKDVPVVPLELPLGWVPPHTIFDPVFNPSVLVPPTGVCVMDPTKIYNILPKQMMPELPYIRRRICRLRTRKQWKFHKYHH